MEEDFNKLRLIAKQLVRTPFQEGWHFRLDIDDENSPDDLDIYVKDITFSPIEIETESIKAGMQTLTYPTGTAPVGLSMTMRDNQDRRIYDWFTAWSKEMINDDGTVNLPYGEAGYVRKAERINLANDEVQDTWFVFPTKLGDITESLDSEGFLEFPISFIQFRSWGE
jgi:hypothetical protein